MIDRFKINGVERSLRSLRLPPRMALIWNWSQRGPHGWDYLGGGYGNLWGLAPGVDAVRLEFGLAMKSNEPEGGAPTDLHLSKIVDALQLEHQRIGAEDFLTLFVTEMCREIFECELVKWFQIGSQHRRIA